jgi:hypothetical protein
MIIARMLLILSSAVLILAQAFAETGPGRVDGRPTWVVGHTSYSQLFSWGRFLQTIGWYCFKDPAEHQDKARSFC